MMNSDDLTLEVRPPQCYGSDSRNIMTALIVMLASKKNVVQSSLQFHRNVRTCYRLGNTGVRISLQFHKNVGMCDSLGDTGAIANAQQIKVVSPTIFE
jgi:hypothetical protein